MTNLIESKIKRLIYIVFLNDHWVDATNESNVGNADELIEYVNKNRFIVQNESSFTMSSKFWFQSYKDYWKEAMSLFLDELPDEKITNAYLAELFFGDGSGGAYTDMVDFIGEHYKLSWATNLSILEAVEVLIYKAKENANIKVNLPYELRELLAEPGEGFIKESQKAPWEFGIIIGR